MKYTRSPQPELFREARRQLKWSQVRLARALGVNKSTISRIEKGTIHPGHRLIEKLHQLTQTPPQQLLKQALHCEHQQVFQPGVALPKHKQNLPRIIPIKHSYFWVLSNRAGSKDSAGIQSKDFVYGLSATLRAKTAQRHP